MRHVIPFVLTFSLFKSALSMIKKVSSLAFASLTGHGLCTCYFFVSFLTLNRLSITSWKVSYTTSIKLSEHEHNPIRTSERIFGMSRETFFKVFITSSEMPFGTSMDFQEHVVVTM
jgi:hypothetical protein